MEKRWESMGNYCIPILAYILKTLEQAPYRWAVYMHIRIFTLPFDAVLEGFQDELVTEFLFNKKVHRTDTQFFLSDGKPYWSVAVHYDILEKEEVRTHQLDENQKLLYERLREWRKETGLKKGVPVFMVATNQQFIEIAQLKVQSLEGLKSIKGWGRGKMERYGPQLVKFLKAFYEKNGGKKEEKAEDLPF